MVALVFVAGVILCVYNGAILEGVQKQNQVMAVGEKRQSSCKLEKNENTDSGIVSARGSWLMRKKMLRGSTATSILAEETELVVPAIMSRQEDINDDAKKLTSENLREFDAAHSFSEDGQKNFRSARTARILSDASTVAGTKRSGSSVSSAGSGVSSEVVPELTDPKPVVRARGRDDCRQTTEPVQTTTAAKERANADANSSEIKSEDISMVERYADAFQRAARQLLLAGNAILSQGAIRKDTVAIRIPLQNVRTDDAVVYNDVYNTHEGGHFKVVKPQIFSNVRGAFGIEDQEFLLEFLSERNGDEGAAQGGNSGITTTAIVTQKLEVKTAAQLGSKSKSYFFFSSNPKKRFVVKSCRGEDLDVLNTDGFLEGYSDHVQDHVILRTNHNVNGNNKSFLPRYLGVYEIQLAGFSSPETFIVMENFLWPFWLDEDHESYDVYDLKGALHGRTALAALTKSDSGSPSTQEAAALVRAARKSKMTLLDNDFEATAAKIDFENLAMKTEFEKQLQSDIEFLKRWNLVDYSLLTGIHKWVDEVGLKNGRAEFQSTQTDAELEQMQEQMRVMCSSNTLSNQESEDEASTRNTTSTELTSTHKRTTSTEIVTDLAIYNTKQNALKISTIPHACSKTQVSFFGIIDILTKYNFKRKCETFWKTSILGRVDACVIPAEQYAERFLRKARDVWTRLGGGSSEFDIKPSRDVGMNPTIDYWNESSGYDWNQGIPDFRRNSL